MESDDQITSLFRIHEADVLMVGVATFLEEDELYTHSELVMFCPFCGTPLQTEEETLRKVQWWKGYVPENETGSRKDKNSATSEDSK